MKTLGISQLPPATAFLSSTWHVGNGPEKCIDGITDGPDAHPGDLCHTNHEQAPWFALDFGENFRVAIDKVLIYHRVACAGCAARTRNVEIRLSDELPTTASSMFTGGNLLGTFGGPATSGQLIEIKSEPRWPLKNGRFLIVQMDNGNDPLNLKEVVAYGVYHSVQGGAIYLQILSSHFLM